MVSQFPTPIVCPITVGRDSERTQLRAFLANREKHVALLYGEAGIGKSRLVADIKADASAQGFLVLQGMCFPTDRSYPYAPLIELLRTLFSHSSMRLDIDVAAFAQDIFPLLPDFVPNQSVARTQLDPEQEKHRLFAALTTFFLNQTSQHPVLLVIEDVHWCDDTSLDFLAYLARHASTYPPLLILITYRNNETNHALRTFLTHLNRERLAQEVALAPLLRTNVEVMLSTIFEQRSTAIDMRRFLHGELLNTLYVLTEGNPFFVEESLTALVTSGDIFYVQGYWNSKHFSEIRIPRSVQDAVQQRIDNLSEAATYVLTLAAVAGKQFDFALLQQLTHYDEDHLLKCMKEMLSAQLVTEVSDDQFAFRHALTRQAIYAQLLSRERSKLHRSIAEALELLFLTTPNTRLEELAYHFYQARVWQKALDYARLAGEKALRLYSHHAAISYFTWALDAIDHLSHPPVAVIYRMRGQAHETLGEFEDAQRDYTGAIEVAHGANDLATEWQGMMDLGSLWAERDYHRAEKEFRQALTLAQTLKYPTLHARSLNRIGNWHVNVEQPHQALDYHRQALAIFQEAGDIHGIAETLDLLGMASYLGGDLIGGTSYYKQAITLFTDLGDQQGLTSSLATASLRSPTFQTDGMVAVASLAESLPDVQQALRIAREIGHRPAEAYALFQLGLCRGSQGNYTLALEAAQSSLNIAEEIEHRQWQTGAHTVLGGIYANLLAFSAAYQHFEKALTLAREIGSKIWLGIATGYLSSAYLSIGKTSQAALLLKTALSPDTPTQIMAQRMLWCASVELALAENKPEQALHSCDLLIASSASAANTEQMGLRVAFLRGNALASLQRLSEAEAQFKAAQTLAETYGAKPMLWRICIALGKLYLAQQKTNEAAQIFETARMLIEELATNVSDEALRNAFLREAMALFPALPALTPKRAMKQAFGGLTAREREIALLIAQGKYNREIAEALVVSERTIETHVSNIMLKLNFTSRRQIAAWITEKGLS